MRLPNIITTWIANWRHDSRPPNSGRSIVDEQLKVIMRQQELIRQLSLLDEEEANVLRRQIGDERDDTHHK